MKMRKIIMIGLVLLLVFGFGCNKDKEKITAAAVSSDILDTANQRVITEKERQSNLRVDPEIKELIIDASKIITWKFNLSHSDRDEIWTYYYYLRFGKVLLNDIKEHDDGEKYDRVYINKLHDTAFTYCGKDTCNDGEKDMTAEQIEYEPYYSPTPMQYLYWIKEAKIIGEEQYGTHNTKVIKFKDTKKRTGKMWMQSHYGFPVKIEFDNGPTVKFENIRIDTLRPVMVLIPPMVDVTYFNGTTFTYFPEI